MTAKMVSNRWKQIVGWAVAGLFVIGFFSSAVAEWTGPILGVWFVGTQRPLRGFVWLMAFAFVPHIVSDWRDFAGESLAQGLAYVAWIFLASLLAVLPMVFHRLASPRLPGFVSTLPFPMAAVLAQILSVSALPEGAFQFLADDGAAKLPLLHIVKGIGGGPFLLLFCVLLFLGNWIVAGIVWMWNYEFRVEKVGWGAAFFGLLIALFAGYAIYAQFSGSSLAVDLIIDPRLVWLPHVGVAVLGLWALLNPGKHKPWAEQQETITLLQSPYTGSRLHLVRERSREALVSDNGERFPIRNGIPNFLKPEELTGDNGKYNHMYETIGGFYDDIQRVFCALKGMDREAYFRGYMSLLEVKPGDSVLETSVGTGLNYKYLPSGVRLAGLDLSEEMLANCQTNLRRWGLEADLYLGNAESLPFADASFDVVFHVGGINFFNDRARAIREMIRVARPGSLLLIADETEKHVKEIYENGPGGHLYKDRKGPVSAPIDLVPAEMREVHYEELRDGQFYALTFRKPAEA
jgi:ubiquinone/menaquinone biosynthesis C-methylase UbiE